MPAAQRSYGLGTVGPSLHDFPWMVRGSAINRPGLCRDQFPKFGRVLDDVRGLARRDDGGLELRIAVRAGLAAAKHQWMPCYVLQLDLRLCSKRVLRPHDGRDRVGPDSVRLYAMHLGPENALKALALLGGGAFLPVHWGTFSLAMHAWDQPAEVLLERAPKAGARLLMPRLGEPVEPEHVERIDPWWRAVDSSAYEETPQPATTLPKAVPWPMD